MPVVGLDVGGTLIKAAVLDDDLHTVARLTRRTPRTPQDPASAVLDEIAGIVKSLRGNDCAAVGVVIPGIVDEHAGIARYSNNLGWQDVPFRDLLAAALDLPVAFGHDVRAGGLAEATVGAASGFGNAAFIPVGTGIAAALITDGRMQIADGYAGELGHIGAGGTQRCACGGIGCLETVAACPAIIAAYGGDADCAQIVAAALDGEPRAATVLGAALDALGTATATLVSLFAPEVVVYGGGLFAGGDALLGGLEKRLADRLTFQRIPQLRVARLGTAAGCIGAGILARRAAR